jgi:hypothetical protein
MLLVLHGAAGGWDELIIALVAFGVMWIAVKLAGRKPATDVDDVEGQDPASDELYVEEEDRAHPPATPRV